MTAAGKDWQNRIEAYLNGMSRRLRGMNDADVREIVQELRSHIIDKATINGEVTAAGVESALAALGSPEELSSQYMTDDLLARAAVSRSPWRILESLFHWASLSFAGFFVLLGTIIGYFLSGAFMLVAILKPFHPQNAGLWIFKNAPTDTIYSLRLGFSTSPPAGTEILGWWIIPIGLGLGCALLILTTRYALWCARQYRKSRALPRA